MVHIRSPCFHKDASDWWTWLSQATRGSRDLRRSQPLVRYYINTHKLQRLSLALELHDRHRMTVLFNISVLVAALASQIQGTLVYCNGTDGPKNGANCNFGATERCCVTSTSIASCEWYILGSQWVVAKCLKGYGCYLQSDGLPQCSSHAIE
jgi:hypothetical protein